MRIYVYCISSLSTSALVVQTPVPFRFLSQVVGSGGLLELACLDMIKALEQFQRHTVGWVAVKDL